jgi:uncharacterized protein
MNTTNNITCGCNEIVLDKTFSIASTAKMIFSYLKKPAGLIFILLITIGLMSTEQLYSAIDFTWGNYVHLFPFLISTVFISVYLQSSHADQLIKGFFIGKPLMGIITAALLGALSPFCSCGVIPVIAGLLAGGVPLSAVMAFWISSPIMSPDMFILTAGELGLEFATVKTISTVFLGVFAGSITLFLQRFNLFNTNNILKEGLSSCNSSCSSVSPAFKWNIWKTVEQRGLFNKGFIKNLLFLSQWMILAYLLESLMIEHVPFDQISFATEGDGLLAIPFAALIGVPSYLNGYAVLPLASGLIEKGFSSGAVLTFITAGAMTSIPAAVAVVSIVKKPVFFLYLFIAFSGSILVGYLYHGWLML